MEILLSRQPFLQHVSAMLGLLDPALKPADEKADPEQPLAFAKLGLCLEDRLSLSLHLGRYIMIFHACVKVNQINDHSFFEEDMFSKSFFISCTRLTRGRSDGTYSSCLCYGSTGFYSSRTFTHAGTLSVVLFVFKREGLRISVDTPYVCFSSFLGETATGCAWILLSLV
jgi:hypothetical protein